MVTTAQSTNYLRSKNYISTNLLKPLFRKVTLRYERMISEKNALRFEFEYGYPVNESYKNILTLDIERSDGSKVAITNRGTVTTSYTFAVGYARYFFPHLNGFYFGGDGFYNYKFYDHKIYHNCNGQTVGAGSYLESRQTHNFGIKPQVGIKVALNKNKAVQLLFDFYAGPAFYLSLENKTTYAYSESCSASYFTPTAPLPSSTTLKPKLGYIIGVNFCVGF